LALYKQKGSNACWWNEFQFNGMRYWESAKTTSKQVAGEAMEERMTKQISGSEIGHDELDKANRPPPTVSDSLEGTPPHGRDPIINPSKRRLTFVKFSDGERFPMLIENSGLPNWFATLFITTQARNASKAPNTLLAMLSAVRGLLAWADSHTMFLEVRLANRQFLGEAEIESLRAFAQSRYASATPSNVKVTVIARRVEGVRAGLHKADARVSSSTHYIRLTYMADYLDWLSVRLLESEAQDIHGESLERIRTMTRSIRLRRPQKVAPSQLSARKGLSPEAQEHLLELVRPNSSPNPFEPAIRKRNELVVQLLYHLGIRASELLALKVSDFDFQRNEVVIARRHDDPADPRRDQPVAKTRDRRLPLSSPLAAAAFHYVMKERDHFPAAKRHDFLLVTHQDGPFQGKPLSMKGLANIFTKIQRAEPVLLASLTAHVLRHTNNDNFSELMDSLQVPEAAEEKQRSYAMGWKEGSGTATTYTRRHTERKAREASLKLQQGWQREKANDKP
jgi:integrase